MIFSCLKLFDLIDHYIGQEQEERSIADILEELLFKDWQKELKTKYKKFGEWVTNTFKEGFDKRARAIENIRKIGKKVIVYD